MQSSQYLNMAAMSVGYNKTMRLFCPVYFPFVVVLLICSLCPSGVICQTQDPIPPRPTSNDIKRWAQNLEKELGKLLYLKESVDRPYEDYMEQKSKMSQPSKDVNMDYEEMEETVLVKEMSVTLSEILRRKREALKKSVIAAEKIARDYPWEREMDISNVKYYNSKTSILSEDEPMEFSDRFGKAVNFNFSSVHIPVEIYEGSNDILNGLNWTSGLDAAFKENYEADPDILWQYFGSQSGFMRTYPATKWKNGDVDLYDVRRQSWYTQGSSSPKDMLILIDTSGSTHGQSLQLMKNAVKSILNTLGENDFVNVVEFSETAKFVSKCFNHTAFVQANFRNKKQLEKDVDKVEALGQADFSVAIKFAFEKFREFARNETNDENNIGANCNKVIMLLTDGGTDNAEDVFDHYNWPNKTVRVFTYAVGPTPNPIHAIRWMACANRGYFSQIPAMGAIRSRVQDYVRVLERPLAAAQAEHSLWTSSHRSIYHLWTAYTEHLKQTLESSSAKHFYWELTFDPREYIPVLSRPQVIKNKKTFEWGNIYEDHLGLGMMTTVTLPVYNHTSESSNQTILGVMGVDVTTAQLEAHTPFAKIGPNGYAFAINPNGYVVFHPNLKTLGKFMNEPPNIDLLELEVDGDTTDLVRLRTAMIKGETDQMSLYSNSLSPCQRYVSYTEATYAFIPIQDTTFRLGISVPTYQKQYPKFTGDINEFEWSDISSDKYTILVAPWAYHKDKDRNKELGAHLYDVVNLLMADNKPENWNLDMVYHLYWDVKLLVKKATTSLLENLKILNASINHKAVFIMANGGITLVAPPSEAAYFEKMRDLRKSSLYTRTLHAPDLVMMADHIIQKRSNTTTDPLITMSHAVKTTVGNVIIDKPAIAGIRTPHEEILKVINEHVTDVTKIINIEKLQEDKDFGGLYTCRDNKALVCYLIDDGGFLISTNRDDVRQQIGRFFGLVDPALMSALTGPVYKRTVQFDFQAACKKEEDTFSAGFRSFSVPSLNLVSEFLTTGFWTSRISWAYSSFNIFSWLFSPSIEVMAENDEDDERVCVKSIQQYYFYDDKPFSQDGGFQCDNCTRNFTAVKLGFSNVLFVVADYMCEECDETYPPVGQAPREITTEEEEDIICQMAQNPRKRVQDYGCYHSDSKEDQTECGCGCLHPSWMSIYTATFLLVSKLISSSL